MRTARLSLGWSILASLAAACGDDDEPEPIVYTGEIAYEVEHYDVALDLASGAVTYDLRLLTSKGGDCLRIGFRAGGAQAVSLGGEPAAGLALDAGRLTVCDGKAQGFAAGSQVVLSVTTTIPRTTQDPLDVGFSTQPDGAGGMFTYLVSWVGGCDLHGPCDARPSLFPTYRFVVAHDEGTQVLCSGVVTAAPTQTTCDFAFPGGPTYSTFGLLARSPAWTAVPLGDWGGVTATLFDQPGSMITQGFDVAQISAQFAWMVDRFGAYPYGDALRFVVGPTHWAGFEHPGNIALADYLGSSSSAYADGLTHTTMHEIVHQWAGDQATLADTYDFVWKEAMAEYLTFVFEDEELAAGVGAETAKAWKAFSVGSSYHLVPDERPELSLYYGDVYGPGPLILFRQLEVMYSRAQVMAAITALIGTGQPRALSVPDVQAALEMSLGVDLDAYFAAWVYGTGRPAWPEASVTFTAGGAGAEDDWTVQVTTTTEDSVARGCAFTVRLVGAAGAGSAEVADAKVSNGVAGGAYAPVVAENLAFVPVEAVIDPEHECLVFAAQAPKPSVPRFW